MFGRPGKAAGAVGGEPPTVGGVADGTRGCFADPPPHAVGDEARTRQQRQPERSRLSRRARRRLGVGGMQDLHWIGKRSE